MSSPENLRSLDLPVALARVGDDEELLREIAQIFVAQCPGVLAEVRAAAEAGDAGALERTAHALKGSVSNLGAETARLVAGEIEEMVRSSNLDGINQALADLAEALSALNADLQRLTSS